MSILIKGMRMAKNCDCCLFDDGVHCMIYPQSEDMVYDRANGKPEFCPLIELPPHGRLVDADALMETFRERKRPTLSDGVDGSKERVRYLDFILTLQAIKDAPTIIEVEEGE